MRHGDGRRAQGDGEKQVALNPSPDARLLPSEDAPALRLGEEADGEGGAAAVA